MDRPSAAVFDFPSGALMIDRSGQVWGAGRRLLQHAVASGAGCGGYARRRAAPSRPKPPSDGDIYFQRAVRGHRLGWIMGAPLYLRRRLDMPRELVLPLYSCRGTLTLGQVPQRFGGLRTALRNEFQIYIETNKDKILASLPFLPPHIQPLPGERTFRARA